MVYTGSFKDISDKYDEVWLIVRSLKQIPQVNTSVFHVPQLSPSNDLFKSYLSWRNQGLWNKNTFEMYYKPRFLQEMKREEAQIYLNLLIDKAKTKDILLVCYCQDESMCHRSLIKEIIERKTVMNKFYLLIAGSRDYNYYEELKEQCDFILRNQITQGKEIIIVSGGARGADELAEQYARERGYQTQIFLANWRKHGKSAGYRRNEAMHNFILNQPSAMAGVICFWDMRSRGTRHNFELCRNNGLPLRVFNTLEHRFLTQEEIERYTPDGV